MVNVVFDMDGVLFDTQRIYYKMWFVVADRLGLSDITEPADKCIGTNRKYQYSVLYDFYELFLMQKQFELQCLLTISKEVVLFLL